MCDTLLLMYMPFADIRDGYGGSIDKQIWWKVFASMAQRPPKWISSETIFIMQVVFMDTTPEMLPNKIYVNLKGVITLENKQLSI